jgi:hypothetical protein
MDPHDDYLKSTRAEARLGLPVGKVPDEDQLTITADEALDAAYHLEGLDWRPGPTRDQIRAAYSALPLGIYLRLPDSKRYGSAEEVLHEAGLAPSRAEGDFLGANPNLPDAVDDGGPPDWGPQSGTYEQGEPLESGSATDTEGLLPGDEPGST